MRARIIWWFRNYSDDRVCSNYEASIRAGDCTGWWWHLFLVTTLILCSANWWLLWEHISTKHVRGVDTTQVCFMIIYCGQRLWWSWSVQCMISGNTLVTLHGHRSQDLVTITLFTRDYNNWYMLTYVIAMKSFINFISSIPVRRTWIKINVW